MLRERTPLKLVLNGLSNRKLYKCIHLLNVHQYTFQFQFIKPALIIFSWSLRATQQDQLTLHAVIVNTEILTIAALKTRFMIHFNKTN